MSIAKQTRKFVDTVEEGVIFSNDDISIKNKPTVTIETNRTPKTVELNGTKIKLVAKRTDSKESRNSLEKEEK